MVISLSETRSHQFCNKNVTERTWLIPIKYLMIQVCLPLTLIALVSKLNVLSIKMPVHLVMQTHLLKL